MWQRQGNFEYHVERCDNGQRYSGWCRCVGWMCAYNIYTGEFRALMG